MTRHKEVAPALNEEEDILSDVHVLHNPLSGSLRQIDPSEQKPSDKDTDKKTDQILRNPAKNKTIHFFRLSKITFDNEYPRRDVFQNVLTSLNHPDFNFLYFICGTKQGISIYLGVKQVVNGEIRAYDHANDYLKPALSGNFPGSELDEIDARDACSHIFTPIMEIENLSMLFGVPSLSSDADEDYQGMDRLLNTMMGEDFQLLIICEPEDRKNITVNKERVLQIYNALHEKSSHNVTENVSNQKTKGRTTTQGTNEGESRGVNTSQGERGDSRSTQKSSGNSLSEAISEQDTDQHGMSFGYEKISKRGKELLEYIDEELLDRFKIGYSKGLFKTAVYLSASYPTVLKRLENTCLSLFQSNEPSFYPLWIREFTKDEITLIKEDILNFELSSIRPSQIREPECRLLSVPMTHSDMAVMATYMTTIELSLVAGLPIKETCGLPLIENVEFGLNCPVYSEESAVNLGSIVHHGREMKDNQIALNIDSLSRHVFVCGVTGSGKTTTCKQLLLESKLPFLVVEPVKTEYRSLLSLSAAQRNHKPIHLFTLGDEKGIPFRLNPFEFLPTTPIAAQADMLKAAFISAFEMEAAIPQIIEMAIYECYKKYGWDIEDDSNRYLSDSQIAWKSGGIFFPTLDDFSQVITEIVESKGFDDRLKNDYIGSIKARIDSLKVGPKGLMLNTRTSIRFEDLLNDIVIMEMDAIRDGQDKALIMGLILFRINEAIRARFKKDPNFKHLTLIEEAHRLLERVPEGVSSAKKTGVEMFANMLAEVRKYGECLIISDQIPCKMTPEVIKNTSTKIVHKLFAKDDREAIGDAISLNDEQKDFLTKLGRGEAVFATEDLNKPVRMRVKRNPTLGIIESDSSQAVANIESIDVICLKNENYRCAFYPEIDFLSWCSGTNHENVWEALSEETKCYYLENRKQMYRLFKRIIEALISEENAEEFRKDLTVMLSGCNEIDESRNNKINELFYACCILQHVNQSIALERIQDKNPEEVYCKLKESLINLLNKKGCLTKVDIDLFLLSSK